MKVLIIALLVACIALAASAVDPGNRAPHKSSDTPTAPPTINPEAIRQGGDTIDEAFAIPEIPFETAGSTTGYTDDYDEVCPYSGSTAPDVVYSLTPPADILVDIDMLGSSYDTKIYVYDESLVLVACNDDFYPDYVSRLRFIALESGVGYYLVIDGYGGLHGDYSLAIREDELCELDCPAGGYPEGEPTLVDDYEDAFNGGCNSPGDPRQDLYGDANGELIFCGVAGWYECDGSSCRDTDWFRVHAGEPGTVTLTAEAEFPTYFMDTAANCNLHVGQYILVEECGSGSLEYEVAPGSFVPFWAGSATFEAPGFAVDNEYDYVIHFTGLMPQPVPTEATSWSTVKALFR